MRRYILITITSTYTIHAFNVNKPSRVCNCFFATIMLENLLKLIVLTISDKINIKIFFSEHISILLEIETSFVPCTNHSLNLWGGHSFATVPLSVTFLEGTLENFYVFFSASTHRWIILRTNVEVTTKGLSETRWSPHCENV